MLSISKTFYRYEQCGCVYVLTLFWTCSVSPHCSSLILFEFSAFLLLLCFVSILFAIFLGCAKQIWLVAPTLNLWIIQHTNKSQIWTKFAKMHSILNFYHVRSRGNDLITEFTIVFRRRQWRKLDFRFNLIVENPNGSRMIDINLTIQLGSILPTNSNFVRGSSNSCVFFVVHNGFRQNMCEINSNMKKNKI